MAKKKTPPSRTEGEPADAHLVLVALMEATAEARHWAMEGIRLAREGKQRDALAAEKKAKAAFDRMEEIEKPYRDRANREHFL